MNFSNPTAHKPHFLNDVIQVRPGKAVTSKDKIMLKSPLLWSPETPTLYNLIVRIRDNEGNVVDGYRRRIGIRSVEFKGKDGFWLNGKPYPSPLIGANRHQDFAVVGNAVANSIHWRDAKKLRDAGMKVIRNAHCPQDPAFMDACDELACSSSSTLRDGNSGMTPPNLHNVSIAISATWYGVIAITLVYGYGNLF